MTMIIDYAYKQQDFHVLLWGAKNHYYGSVHCLGNNSICSDANLHELCMVWPAEKRLPCANVEPIDPALLYMLPHAYRAVGCIDVV